MWFLLVLVLLLSAGTELTLSNENMNRLILRNGKTPCEGYLEVYHEGSWGYVGDDEWSNSTEEVVCRSIHCGKPKSVGNFVLRDSKVVWLNHINCSGTEKQLWDCAKPGWGTKFTKDSVKWIQCSDKVEIDMDGFNCEGLVRYSIEGSVNKTGYFCAENFGTSEASLLCKKHGCGEVRDIAKKDWLQGDGLNNSDKMMMMNCSDNWNSAEDLWRCVTTADSAGQQCLHRASVSCTGHKKVQLNGSAENVCSGQLLISQDGTGTWSPVTNLDRANATAYCKQMFCGTLDNYNNSTMELKCKDNVNVTLMHNGNPSTCYGDVHITINGAIHPVCGTDWSQKDAEVVCKELGCGELVAKESVSSVVTNGILDNVECSGGESSLWHCPAKRQNKFLSCSSKASVVCADSTKVRLVDGLGKCAGRVEIQYQGRWQRVAEGEVENNFLNGVCKLRDCGKTGTKKTQGFSQGSGPFFPRALTCPTGVKNIAECIKDNKPSTPGAKALELTCKAHKVVFLDGNKSCSGMVGIEQGNKKYWLSGSGSTWNKESADAVCRQMHCGSGDNYSLPAQSSQNNSVWKESYNCTANSASLFKCDRVTVLPVDHKNNIAAVNCTGNISVSLTNGCWGTVIISVGDNRGGVCKETWSNDKSDTLCQNLGCGAAIPQTENPAEEERRTKVIVKSLHSAGGNTNFNHSLMVMNDEKDTSCNLNPAYVVCSGSLKSNIEASRYKCSGNVKVLLEGQWLPVCKSALTDTDTQNTICKEMECGEHLEVVDYFGPPRAYDRVISELKCPSTGNKTIKECSAKAEMRTCPLGVIRCSGWKKMELKFGQSCSGAVFVHSREKTSAVSSYGWTEKEGRRLCQDLKCGDFKSNRTEQAYNPFWDNSFRCEGDPKNIWKCEKSPLPANEQQQQLFIECRDEPQVTISETCRGEVRINNVNVHSDSNSSDYADIVCKEKKCREAVFVESKTPANKNAEVYHINCEKYHDRLGKCSRYKGKPNKGVLSVYCIENVQFNTTEKCGGRISVNYRNKWEPVCFGTLSSRSQELLCQKLGCGGRNSSIRKINNSKKVQVYTRLNCTEKHEDIRYCVKDDSCGYVKPAEVYCYGYKPTSPVPPNRLVPIILGTGFLLVVVVLIILFARFRLVRRSKKPVNVALRPLPRPEEEFESDDYEGVKHPRDEIKTFGHDRFTSEAEVMAEGDVHSNASFPYDDIDEARPLASSEANAVTSGPVYINKDAPTDETNYEVDDPQESYDDIEAAIPVVTQAEVHSTSQNVPENEAGLVAGGDDYLVPGQDD